jgi:hypothetical protein
MKYVLGAACAALLAMTAAASAQQSIEWKQVLNLPKGLNQPPGVKLDVLGIELGDSYAEVKAKFEALLKEVGKTSQSGAPKPPTSAQDYMNRSLAQMGGEASSRPITEVNRIIRFHTPGGPIQAEYVGEARLSRELKGGHGKVEERITVLFSAPSSGHQALSIHRVVRYRDKTDQPRIPDLIALLSQKLKGQPVPTLGGVRFIYDNGVLQAAEPSPCIVGVEADNPRTARSFNPNGACDVVYQMTFSKGISDQHAAAIEFRVTDSERAKQDILADFAFFNSYVQNLQNRTGGAAPKL